MPHHTPLIATIVAGTSQIMRNMIAGGMGLKPQ